MELIFFIVSCIGLCFGPLMKNSVYNTGMFQLSLSSACRGSRSFLLLTLQPPATRLGVHKKLGGGTAETADLTWPQGYSIPYDIVLSNKSRGASLLQLLNCSFKTVLPSEVPPTSKTQKSSTVATPLHPSVGSSSHRIHLLWTYCPWHSYYISIAYQLYYSDVLEKASHIVF